MILYFLKKNNIFYTTAPYTYKKSENFMKNSLIRGTLILTLAGLITRFIGFFYRIFLANFLGEEQLGIYQLVLPLYSICFTIYGAGLQTALSQLVSGSKSSRQNGIIKAALVLSISTAVTLSFFVFLKADWLAQKYFHEPQAASLLQILSILFPFCGHFLYGQWLLLWQRQRQNSCHLPDHRTAGKSYFCCVSLHDTCPFHDS